MSYTYGMGLETEEIWEWWADARPEGRRPKKGKRLNPNSLTGKAIRNRQRREGQARRREAAQMKLTNVAIYLSALDERDTEGEYLHAYAEWVAQSRREGHPMLDRGDVEIDSTTPPVGAGGEHRDHKRTARRMFHELTGIEVVSADRAGGEDNTDRAFERMYEKLDNHLRIWNEILPKKLPEGEITARVLAELRSLTPLTLGQPRQ